MRDWIGYVGRTIGEKAGMRPKPARDNAIDWTKLPLISLGGEPFDPSRLKGRTVLVVNVASKCGLTPQYKGLQRLHEQYEGQGLIILGVPCNQFLSQEPGESSAIQEFCSLNYGVDFPLLEKQCVAGPDRSVLYTRLIESAVGEGKPIRWNFEKFLVGKNGEITNRFTPKTVPSDPRIVQALEQALTQSE